VVRVAPPDQHILERVLAVRAAGVASFHPAAGPALWRCPALQRLLVLVEHRGLRGPRCAALPPHVPGAVPDVEDLEVDAHAPFAEVLGARNPALHQLDEGGRAEPQVCILGDVHHEGVRRVPPPRQAPRHLSNLFPMPRERRCSYDAECGGGCSPLWRPASAILAGEARSHQSEQEGVGG